MRLITHAACLIGFMILLFSPRADAQEQYRLYVSHGGDKVSVFNMNAATGRLTLDSSVEVGRNPGAMAVNAARSRLYVSVRGENSFATLKIDPTSGRLTMMGKIDVGANAAYLSVNAGDSHLFGAYYGDNKISMHKLDERGLPIADGAVWYDTQVHPHAILADRSGRFVYVPNTGSHLVMIYRFDAAFGKLTPANPPLVNVEPETGPRHVAFSKDNRFVYFVNEKASSVTACVLNAKDGSFTAMQTLSTLSDGFADRNTCADVEVSPSGRFLYASNRGHDSIAMFALDQSTGRLTALGQAPTEQIPRSFNIDPTGRFLYAAGQRSGKLAAYSIDEQTGKLTRFETYDAPQSPSWVQIVRLPKP